MSFDDWMLALHLLSAFAWVAGVLVFWLLILAVRRTDSAEETIRMEPIATVGNVAVGVGMVGTIVLGLWLAFYSMDDTGFKGKSDGVEAWEIVSASTKILYLTSDFM